MAFATAAFIAAAWTTRSRPTPLPPEFIAAKKPIPASFVDDSKCASCHSDVARKFAHSGMGRAFNTWKEAEPIEDRTEGPGPVLTLGDLHYQVVIDRGRMFQREFRIVDGVEVEFNRREAIYTLGSGTKGRGYLASDGGYLTALPLSWYSARRAWDFSPGYRNANLRFSRPIRVECMSCHNSMVGVLPGSINGYVEPLPTGLGCQRCHGPGASHVHYQQQGVGGVDPMPNIAKMEPRLQNDVCLQCHLLSDDALTRGDCNGFTPGDRLADCRVNYFNVRKGSSFDAVGHGPRSMASKCYTASGGKMTCIRCHDPHRPAREVPRADYNQRCNKCHDSVPCKRPLKPMEAPRQGDCVSCHMPTRKAEDIPHASSTEHWIHVPGRLLGAPFPAPKNPAAKTVAWTVGATPIEDAVAELRHSIQQEGQDECRQATTRLEDLLKNSSTPNRAAWLEAAKGYLYLGDMTKTQQSLSRMASAGPSESSGLHIYARFLGRTGAFAASAEVLEKCLKTNPWFDAGDLELLDALGRSGAEPRAFELYDRYVQFHPPDVDVLLLLGDMRRRVKAPNHEAAAYYKRAAAADGVRPEPHSALARLAMTEQSYVTAVHHARAATLRSPSSAPALTLEAACLEQVGDHAAARIAVDKALALDPANAEAGRLLRRLETDGSKKR